MPGGYVTLDPSRGTSVRLLLPADAIDRSGGVGGWQSSERSQRRPSKWWSSIPDDTMTINGILDIDALAGPAIEVRLERLRVMGQKGGRDEPPTIRVKGDIWRPDQRIHWVMSDLTLGSRLWLPNGKLRRQQVTVALERFTEVDDIDAVKVRSTRKRGERRKRVVRSRGGDSLRTIALRELGASGRWKDLRRWNKPLRRVDPDERLRTGTHVTVR